jgi:hypothetical protein
MNLTAILLLGAESLFDGKLIKGVGNAGHTLADEGIGLRVDLHIRGIRNLLDTDNDLHLAPPYGNF